MAERSRLFTRPLLQENAVGWHTGRAIRPQRTADGVRIKNNRTTKRNNKTGRQLSIKAPKEQRRSREVPHLAVVSKETWTRVNKKMHEANACYRNGIVKARTRRSMAGATLEVWSLWTSFRFGWTW